MFETSNTRREFLQKGLTLLAMSSTVPGFLNRTVLAMADPLDVRRTQQPDGRDGRILVVVQLSGGNDGLNTVIPHGDDNYYRRRSSLALDRKAILRIDDYLGLHPNLRPLMDMLQKGRLAIVQGVGYPNPNRSHFRSMDIWHSAQPERSSPGSGWIGRYFDNTCSGADPHVGVCIDDQVPLAMQGQRITPLSFERPEFYRYNGPDRARYEQLIQPRMLSDAPGAARGADAASQLDFLERTALDAQLSSDQILRVTRGHSPAVAYPAGQFGNALRTVAAMIRGGLPTRVYYVSLGGFDTHANQRGRHDQLMQQLASGVSAFWADMAAQKNDQRVLMMTFSEFGRRVEQNASGGTDHGAAAPMLLMGPAVQQGILGRHPSLTDLDQGDLKFSIDFRSVYATVLQNWLQTPSKPILGQQFSLLPVIRA